MCVCSRRSKHVIMIEMDYFEKQLQVFFSHE
jgi:hypothetical protein